MRVAITHESSATVRDAFLKHGHDAISCDVLETEIPGPHHVGDAVDFLKNNRGRFDLVISHPPCTYLCSSGLHWNKRRPGRAIKTAEAVQHVRDVVAAIGEVVMYCIENSGGCLSTLWRPYDQKIQPYNFGHDASKGTCLWLRGLPTLQGTEFIEPRYVCKCGVVFAYALGKYGCPDACGGVALPRWGNQTDSGQNNLPPSKDRWKIRSKTYEGIAEAMAAQWGGK